jgi:hypothetical protein
MTEKIQGTFNTPSCKAFISRDDRSAAKIPGFSPNDDFRLKFGLLTSGLGDEPGNFWSLLEPNYRVGRLPRWVSLFILDGGLFTRPEPR